MTSVSIYKNRDYDWGMVLQSLRTKAGLKQTELAKLAGVSEKSIQNWESGVTYPKAASLQKLIEIFAQRQAFTAGHELTEAESLWEKALSEAPRFNVPFDTFWFKTLLHQQKSTHLTVVPSPAPQVPPPHNLPNRLTSFVGRQAELDLLTDWLKPAETQTERTAPPIRLVTLRGTGGVGKTSLAIEAGCQLLPHYPDGCWLVELAALQNPNLVNQQIAFALKVAEPKDGSPVLNSVIAHLKERRALLILDNCEHLVEACAVIAERLLTECAQLRLIITSREVLNIDGEQIYHLPSLSFPQTEAESSIEAMQMLDFPAVRLFVERARSVQHQFSLNAENSEAVSQICRYLGGIPLALELAAARLKILSVAQIAARLNTVFDLLTEGRRTALPRQQTLRATIEWSYGLLGEPEQRLFERLSVFAGSFDTEAVKRICSDDKLEQAEIFALLGRLVDKSLVTCEESAENSPPRYKILETLRQFGQEKLQTANQLANLQERFGQYYLELAQKAEPELKGATQLKWLNYLDTEYPNLRVVLEWSMAAPYDISRGRLGLQLGAALGRFWIMRGYLNEGRAALEGLQRLANSLGLQQTPEYGWALNRNSILTQLQGDYDQVEALLQESLTLFKELNDKAGIAESLNQFGAVNYHLGNYPRALSYFEEVLLLRRELGDKQAIANTLNNLGATAQTQGNHEIAERYHEESLSIRREIADKHGMAHSLNNLAGVATLKREYTKAIGYVEESLKIRREIGDKHGILMSILNLGKGFHDQKIH
jgi:predicted ATPase/transcriptional regulator with XRE-family HTH domain